MRLWQRSVLIILPPLTIWLLIGYVSLQKVDWGQSHWLTLYPVNGDQTQLVDNYINALADEHFWAIEQFINQQAKYYLKQDYPVLRVRLAPPLSEPPASYPIEGNFIQRLWWSLEIRWWRTRLEAAVGQVVLLQYYSPQNHPRLAHSLGVPELGLGVVHAYATPFKADHNNILIGHELLHLYGASDKYDPQTGKALYPQGYAEPQRQPRYPQHYGEMMAITIPLSTEKQRWPQSLEEMMIGPLSAAEVGWLD